MEAISKMTSTVTSEMSSIMDDVPGLFSLVATLTIMIALTV
jgi:hypothetical protein